MTARKGECVPKKPKSAECRRLSPSADNPLAGHTGPIVIVVGDSDDASYRNLAKYRRIMLEAFDGYRGVIISGGTQAGVSRIVGDIAAANSPHITAIGYLPAKTGGIPIDERYTQHIRTSGTRFSAREMIRYWQDILDAGIDPGTVRLIGIGGGQIADAEYRTALAMGAKVAIFPDSGRAASQLLSDAHCSDDGNIRLLPADAMALHNFIVSSSSATADGSHATFRSERRNKGKATRALL